MDHNERIDHIIRVRLQRMRFSGDIEPSPGFTSRTMKRIYKLERRHQILRDTWVLLLALLPVGLREAWTLLRGDFVAASELPFGSVIVSVYRIFMSQLGITVLLGLSIVVFLGYVFRFRRTAPLNARIA